MQRLFVLLMEEMKRLGAQVIAANFNSVLIYTNKRNVTAAVGYTRYLLDTLSKRETLSWLQLVPQRWWNCLHYADEFNYGGVEAAVSTELWESAGMPQQSAAAAGEDEEEAAAAQEAAASEVDDAEIGTPGGPKLRLVNTKAEEVLVYGQMNSKQLGFVCLRRSRHSWQPASQPLLRSFYLTPAILA